ncbi:glycoside hydrolase family 2 [Enterococcus timonensis]|uniref:glycoside hydrolase family 2 n=1 Tax=Enterococcus timonensis TaxID=1852364 RepID=UPI0008DABFD9|nr:glycoside hydrolase family 2 [Enterococcus timonensis]
MKTQIGESFYFHQDWHFLLADCFPLQKALDCWQDAAGNYFYQANYQEENWQEITIPHTFNDADLFKNRIRDAGSSQKRTMAFYRNWLEVPENRRDQKVLLEFFGVRQTCYCYVNGELAGFYEAGVAPFGFDISEFIIAGQKNLIAIATDNTTTREIPFCIAETPNNADAVPGSYLQSQEETVDKSREGVGYFWNCNDFNPSLGGLSKPIKVHFKPNVYLTLPLYSNLQTKGCYIYPDKIDLQTGLTTLSLTAEIRNESTENVSAYLQVDVCDLDNRVLYTFSGHPKKVSPVGKIKASKSIIPEDAYIWDKQKNGYQAIEDEAKILPTRISSELISELTAQSGDLPLRLWSIVDPYLYRVKISLIVNDEKYDEAIIETGFRKIDYDPQQGILLNGTPIWLRGYAQRATNEWAAIGQGTPWLRDFDAQLIKESNANHIRFMHVAGSVEDIQAYDRHGVVVTQPAGDKERENFGRQWDQRVELMRDVIIAFRNHPAIFFWEAGNNSISKEHMREMRLLKEQLDSNNDRFMGCRTINTEEVLNESEYVGTMLNRHAAKFLAQHGPIMETEYSREEAPKRIWDDFTPPDYDYRNKYLGQGGKKQPGMDFYDLTSEDLTIATARGYSEFFNDRITGASNKDLYAGCAALCWTDSAQHGRQSFSENARMSGRVDPIRLKKQNFYVFQTMQSDQSAVKIVGHWNYPPLTDKTYWYEEKRFNGSFYEGTGELKQRDPHKKTLYVVASYNIKKVELLINGELVGQCQKPISTFIFPFENIDVTRNGKIEALAYDFSDQLVAEDIIETTGKPSRLRLTPKTSPIGWTADGYDLALVDVEVLDDQGRVCVLSSDKIEFSTTGAANFLGGYNSGRFDGFDHNDSVIHQNHVYAECGVNRVFLRSGKKGGNVKLTAEMAGLPVAELTLMMESKPLLSLDKRYAAVNYENYLSVAPIAKKEFTPIPAADALKYIPEKENYSKILIDGQEPDTRGVRTVNENGRIWGAVLCILDRLQPVVKPKFTYSWQIESGELTVLSGNITITAQVGRTHLLVNGEENLMDGQPYLSKTGQLVMEVTALIPFIQGCSVQYDEKVNVLRIETD